MPTIGKPTSTGSQGLNPFANIDFTSPTSSCTSSQSQESQPIGKRSVTFGRDQRVELPKDIDTETEDDVERLRSDDEQSAGSGVRSNATAEDKRNRMFLPLSLPRISWEHKKGFFPHMHLSSHDKHEGLCSPTSSNGVFSAELGGDSEDGVNWLTASAKLAGLVGAGPKAPSKESVTRHTAADEQYNVVHGVVAGGAAGAILAFYILLSDMLIFGLVVLTLSLSALLGAIISLVTAARRRGQRRRLEKLKRKQQEPRQADIPATSTSSPSKVEKKMTHVSTSSSTSTVDSQAGDVSSWMPLGKLLKILRML